MFQTAEIECQKRLKMHKMRQLLLDSQNQAQLTEQHLTPPEDSLAPVIDLHLRPATVCDIPDIRGVYNQYTHDSAVPEDQSEVAISAMLELWKIVRKDKLPFLVAISGPIPNGLETKKEVVIGFAYAESRNRGLRNLYSGRSRQTAYLQLYVHKEYLQKGVGSALMDKLLDTTCMSYSARLNYNWIKPTRDHFNVYCSGGTRCIYSVLIEIPIDPKDEAHYTWVGIWLKRKFKFAQVARLESVARSTKRNGTAHFLDIAIFQKFACHVEEFGNVD